MALGLSQEVRHSISSGFRGNSFSCASPSLPMWVWRDRVNSAYGPDVLCLMRNRPSPRIFVFWLLGSCFGLRLFLPASPSYRLASSCSIGTSSLCCGSAGIGPVIWAGRWQRRWFGWGLAHSSSVIRLARPFGLRAASCWWCRRCMGIPHFALSLRLPNASPSVWLRVFSGLGVRR